MAAPVVEWTRNSRRAPAVKAPEAKGKRKAVREELARVEEEVQVLAKWKQKEGQLQAARSATTGGRAAPASLGRTAASCTAKPGVELEVLPLMGPA